jgi:predicted metal-binding membrane protein
MVSERVPTRAFVAVAALLFVASAAATIVWTASMPAMGEMSMAGPPAASFLGMWVVMTVAMMLPSLVPMLWRYRQAVAGDGETRLGPLTALAGAGYFLVWTGFGVGAYTLGAAFMAAEMGQPALGHALPVGAALVVLAAGLLQFTTWKTHHLACCRQALAPTLPASAATALRHGLRLGLHCCACCGGLMAVLLVVGVMDLRVMAAVAAAITVERLAPAGEWIARGIGILVVGSGLFLIARAAGLG